MKINDGYIKGLPITDNILIIEEKSCFSNESSDFRTNTSCPSKLRSAPESMGGF